MFFQRGDFWHVDVYRGTALLIHVSMLARAWIQFEVTVSANDVSGQGNGKRSVVLANDVSYTPKWDPKSGTPKVLVDPSSCPENARKRGGWFEVIAMFLATGTMFISLSIISLAYANFGSWWAKLLASLFTMVPCFMVAAFVHALGGGFILWRDNNITGTSWETSGIKKATDRQEIILPQILETFGTVEAFNTRLQFVRFDCMANSQTRAIKFIYFWFCFSITFVLFVSSGLANEDDDADVNWPIVAMFWAYFLYIGISAWNAAKVGVGCCALQCCACKPKISPSVAIHAPVTSLGTNVKGALSQSNAISMSYFPVPQLYLACNIQAFYHLHTFFSLDVAVQYYVRFACYGLGIGGAILITYIVRVAFGDEIVEDSIDGAMVGIMCFGVILCVSFVTITSIIRRVDGGEKKTRGAKSPAAAELDAV